MERRIWKEMTSPNIFGKVTPLFARPVHGEDKCNFYECLSALVDVFPALLPLLLLLLDSCERTKGGRRVAASDTPLPLSIHLASVIPGVLNELLHTSRLYYDENILEYSSFSILEITNLLRGLFKSREECLPEDASCLSRIERIVSHNL